MRLSIDFARTGHDAFGTHLCWLDDAHLISCGDDHRLIIWSADPLMMKERIALPDDFYPTRIALPIFAKQSTTATRIQSTAAASGNQNTSSSASVIIEKLAVGSSDGRVHLISFVGGELSTKQLQCHQAAVTALHYSEDGSVLLTASEDGQLKIWSSSGLFRCTLATHAHPIHNALFASAPDTGAGAASTTTKFSTTSPYVAYTFADQLSVSSLAPNAQPSYITVHKSNLIVLLAYCPSSHRLITSDECGCVRMFDLQGHQLMMIPSTDTQLTAIDCSSHGQIIATASIGCLQLLSFTGDTQSLQHISGLIRHLRWSPDGKQLACIRMDGMVGLARLFDITYEWAQFTLQLNSSSSVTLCDATTAFEQQLDFPGTCIRHVQMAFDMLLILVDTHCHLYALNESSVGAGNSLSLGASSVHLPLMSRQHFALIDETGACSIYDYQCRRVNAFRSIWPANQMHRLTRAKLSLNKQWLAVQDAANEKRIQLIQIAREASASKQASKAAASSSSSSSTGLLSYNHQTSISSIALADDKYYGQTLLSFLDANRDLHLLRIDANGQASSNQLLVNCDAHLWHEQAPLLAAIQQANMHLFQCPLAAFIDAELLQLSHIVRKLPAQKQMSNAAAVQLLSFTGGFVQLQLSNGLRFPAHFNPLVVSLYAYLKSDRVQQALALVRLPIGAGSANALWCIFTCIRLFARDLASAEIGYAALHCTEKVLYLQRLAHLCQEWEQKNGTIAAHIRSSEIALLCGDGITQAEDHLINAGLPVRLVLMHVQMFNWPQALNLARKLDPLLKGKALTDAGIQDRSLEGQLLARLVLTHRLDYLGRFKRKETEPEFQKLQQQVDLLDDQTLQLMQDHQYAIQVKLK